jgi:deoxyinosine 3'endonuclease (endonuclease V)
MIHAFDTYYFDNIAKTVCISFRNWDDEKQVNVFSEEIEIKSDYISGKFYKRELPCLLSLISKLDIKKGDIIIVDGYVTLNSENKKGLGSYLYEELNQQYPVIGVAKNEFSEKDDNRIAILRGSSQKPLFITSKGIDIELASSYIRDMKGNFRFPDLLKKLDQLTRE